MESYDILNNLTVNNKVKNVQVVGYVINEVNLSQFIKRDVEVVKGCKFVQIATSYFKDYDKDEYFLESIIYASVPETVKVGESYLFFGTLSTLKGSNSTDITLFKFVKKGDKWFIDAVDVSPLDSLKVKDSALLNAIKTALKYPFTTTLNGGILKPMTKLFREEIDYSLDSKLSFKDGKEPVDVNLPSLSDIQNKVFSEMLSEPLLQVRCIGGVFLGVEDLLRETKQALGKNVLFYDLRGKNMSLKNVLRKLEVKSDFDSSTMNCICLVDAFEVGFPSIYFGTEVRL